MLIKDSDNYKSGTKLVDDIFSIVVWKEKKWLKKLLNIDKINIESAKLELELAKITEVTKCVNLDNYEKKRRVEHCFSH